MCVDAGAGDRLDVAVVGAAAAAEHVDLRVLLQQLAVFPAELDRIAGVELGRRVELRVAAPRGVGAEAADALDPGLVGVEHLGEVGRVGAVDHEVGRRAAGRLVDGDDRLLQRLRRSAGGRRSPA